MAADFVRPMMIRQPPALGSKAPGDVAGLLREAGRIAGMSQRNVQQLVRIFTMSVGDWLDSLFENDYLKGSIASTGVVGVWAGPYSPGTAYNLLHHALGELDGNVGSWGQVIGGMGAISEAIAASARAAGAEIRTESEVVSIDSTRRSRHRRHARRRHRAPRSDRRLRRAPEDDDHGPRRRRRTSPPRSPRTWPPTGRRGASVKVNMVLSEPPAYEGLSEEDSTPPAHRGRQLLPLARLPRARLAGRGPRRPRREPLHRRSRCRSSIDPSLTDDGRWIATMFTQYGPPGSATSGRRARASVRRHAASRTWRRFAPNLPGAIEEREVLAPPDLEDIFGLAAARSSRASRTSPRWRSCAPRRASPSTRRRCSGLYLCGAGTHPGGGVMAASGHNAAQRILKDRRGGAIRRRLARARA